jgi:hypothetical protein
MVKTASTREIIKKLEAYEKMYGIGSVISIGSISCGDRDVEYVFHIKDKDGNEKNIEISSVEEEILKKGFSFKNPSLKNSRGCRESMSNLWYRKESSIVEIEDVVEDSNNATELVNGLNNLKLLRKFTLDKETDKKVRLKAVDSFGNTSYFEVEKE